MSQKIPTFTYHDVTKRLRKLGFTFFRQGKGSYEIWHHPDGRWTTVPRHGNKIISRRTMKSILDTVGMDGSSFRSL